MGEIGGSPPMAAQCLLLQRLRHLLHLHHSRHRVATVCVVGVVHALDARRQVIGATRMQAIVDSVVGSTTCADQIYPPCRWGNCLWCVCPGRWCPFCNLNTIPVHSIHACWT